MENQEKAVMETREEEASLAAEIGLLNQRLQSLTNETSYKQLLVCVKREEEIKNKIFVRRKFLLLLNDFLKKESARLLKKSPAHLIGLANCADHNFVHDLARNPGERFISDLQKFCKKNPIATDTYQKYLRLMRANQNIMEAVKWEISVLENQVKTNSILKDYLFSDYERQRRGIKKDMERKKNALRELREKISLLKNAAQIFPTPTVRVAEEAAGQPPHMRRKTKKEAPVISPKQTPSPKIWKFFLVSSRKNSGTSLPRKKKKFVKVVNNLLRKRKELRTFDANIFYNKLMSVASMDKYLRQSMDQINGNNSYKGWKKMEIGDYYRVLLGINEEQQIIYCLPIAHKFYEELRRG